MLIVTRTATPPSASIIAMLAARYGADNGRITRIITASTVLAFASFTRLVRGFWATAEGVIPST